MPGSGRCRSAATDRFSQASGEKVSDAFFPERGASLRGLPSSGARPGFAEHFPDGLLEAPHLGGLHRRAETPRFARDRCVVRNDSQLQWWFYRRLFVFPHVLANQSREALDESLPASPDFNEIRNVCHACRIEFVLQSAEFRIGIVGHAVSRSPCVCTWSRQHESAPPNLHSPGTEGRSDISPMRAEAGDAMLSAPVAASGQSRQAAVLPSPRDSSGEHRCQR